LGRAAAPFSHVALARGVLNSCSATVAVTKTHGFPDRLSPTGFWSRGARRKTPCSGASGPGSGRGKIGGIADRFDVLVCIRPYFSA
jgi:hypothetical protein